MDRLSFFASDLYELSPFKLQSCWSSSSVQARGTSGGVRGCRHRSEHEQEVQEEIQERRTVQRKEIPEPVLECEMLEAPAVPGSSCSRKM